jgi:solute carrier family 39 (zinc transporter), member 1/2/3
MSDDNSTLAEELFPPEDPCASSVFTEYDRPFHIGACFIVIFVSFLGVFTTLIGKRNSCLQLPDLVIKIGKTLGTGIILACAFIHMLEPAADSFASECIGDISEEYGAYAFLFSMLSAIFLHNLSYILNEVAQVVTSTSKPLSLPTSAVIFREPSSSLPTSAVIFREPKKQTKSDEANNAQGSGMIPPQCEDDCHAGEPCVNPCVNPTHEEALSLSSEGCDSNHGDSAHHHHHHHHHSPFIGSSALALPPASVFVQVLMIEFSLSAHSVIIGLALGIAPDDELKTLLVALCFHQFFEGVSLGAKLAESNTGSVLDWLLAVIFAISASVGMGVGISLIGTTMLEVSGKSYLLSQGIIDAVCSGILLYLGFSFLLLDFPTDVGQLIQKEDIKSSKWKRISIQVAMLSSLWIGAGAMAVIGRWL